MDYDYEAGKSRSGRNVDEFRTILWRSTTSICIAIKETFTGSGRFFVVAHFFPVGNIDGEYTNNVLRRV